MKFTLTDVDCVKLLQCNNCGVSRLVYSIDNHLIPLSPTSMEIERMSLGDKISILSVAGNKFEIDNEQCDNNVLEGLSINIYKNEILVKTAIVKKSSKSSIVVNKKIPATLTENINLSSSKLKNDIPEVSDMFFTVNFGNTERISINSIKENLWDKDILICSCGTKHKIK